MNKNELKKDLGQHVRLRPMAKRFVGGPSGPQVPPVDDDWLIQAVDKTGIRISNGATGHGTVLGYDHIREFTTDPVRGQGYGTLILKTQVHVGGNHLWTEPIGPTGPAPDQFQNVRAWKRENDAAHIQGLYASTRPASAIPAPATGNSALLGLGLLALGVGVGIAIAKT
ncbi:hypothetical protein [uncultured Paludibaculum sp.]|uniref:hypothetical protein n=1 Tax=uncultured Paludibaculum sp. TaxID=1765020 RepID=UPI002AAB3B6C|nr:hypothetical protein [uncultured Paludibaculum sp.]